MKECLYMKQQELNNQLNQVQQLIDIISSSRNISNNNNNDITQQNPGSKSIPTSVHKGAMPCWYYDKKELRDTPSILDGISFENERRYRKEGARFIMSCGTEMGLGHNTIATGVVYFHRFYMFHSFKSFPRYVTACCCLFLAGKVEETPKKCRDIIKTARARLTDIQFYSFGDDPKEEVMTLERILLQTIKFDLQVEHPYTFLLKYAKSFKGDQQKLQKMVQMAWNFVNDSLSTVVCLQWEPEIIAVALIHLASKLSKFTVADWVGRQTHHLRWWDMFVSDVTMEILEDICHQVLDLYQTQQQQQPESHSPPQKPPSRADSPTPASKNQTPSSVPIATETPVAKSKPLPASATTNVVATAASAPPPPVPELNNIQSIKSLGTAPPSASVQENLSAASVAAAAAAYHLYAPHQMHPMYSSGPAPPPPHAPTYGGGPAAGVMGGTTVTAPPPLPPPPPMAPYASGWPPSAMASSHYGPGVPPIPPGAVSGPMPPSGRAPPPPPPGAGGGYYQPPHYGRQTRY